jgi:hypothetical protein
MAVKRSVDVGPIQLQPRIIVYATIIQLASFAFFDAGGNPWSEDRFLTLIAVSLGPMFALAMAHIFSEILDHDVRGILSRANLQEIFRSNIQFLYVGIIPIILAIPMSLAGMEANTTISTIFVAGVLSLFVWGGIAARLAGRPTKQQLTFAIAYGLIGCVIVALELWLHH